MENIFLGFVNRGIVAGWIILAVIGMRILLKRAPKWMHCLLWGLAAVRLACPFSLESVFSLVPSRETVSVQRHTEAVSGEALIDSGFRFVDRAVSKVIDRSAAPVPEASADPLQIWLFAGSLVWVFGIGILVLYALVSYIRLYLHVRTAVRLEGRIMQSEFVNTPFIFGIIRPRIYLPSGMAEELRQPVVAHELAHLKRHDNLWKAIGYVLLVFYWFQPLCWAAYILLCRDIELACDERVIRDYDMHQKRVYSEALLECSMDRRNALACPLAFGEVGVKARIRSVIHYKKPAFWVMAAAAAVCVIAAVCFLTDPVKDEEGSGKVFSADAGNSGGQGKNGEADRADGSSTENRTGSWDKTGANGTSGSGSGNGQDTEDVQAARREAFVRDWAAAFVKRDGNAIEAMMDPALAAEMLEGPEGERTFGFSSPWPMDEEKDVYILQVGEESAQIRYYAWTSDPHVTAWAENITFELRDENYVVTSEELIWLDDISTGEAFGLAYGYPPIDGSRMDYETNGAGESLNANAMLSSSDYFGDLFDSRTAAIKLLNLSDSKVKVERIYEEENSVNLEITFPEEEEGMSYMVTMVRSYGNPGIWLPKSYKVDPMARLSERDWAEIRRRNLHVNERGTYEWTEDISCIAELPEADIRIYGYADAECSGEGVAIDIGGVVNYFDWFYISPHGILPDCYWDEPGKKLQVALRTYTGTGASAQELHVLRQSDTGVLSDNALELNDYRDMLQKSIGYTADEEKGLLTLFDTRDQKELMTMEVAEGKAESLELGLISDFLLGETIRLSLDPGYFAEGSPIAEYPGGRLEAEVLLVEREGEILFELGEIRAVEDSVSE